MLAAGIIVNSRRYGEAMERGVGGTTAAVELSDPAATAGLQSSLGRASPTEYAVGSLAAWSEASSAAEVAERRDARASFHGIRLGLEGLVLVGVAAFGGNAEPATKLAVVGFALAAFGLLALRDQRPRPLRLDLIEQLRATTAATTLAALAAVSVGSLLGADAVARELVWPWLIGTVLVASVRATAVAIEAGARRTGGDAVPTLIIGAGRIGRLTAKRLEADPAFGLRPIGFLDKEPLEGLDGHLPVLGASWDFDRVVREHDVGHVIVTFSTAPHDVLLRIARSCDDHGIKLSVVPRLFERITERVTVEHAGGLALATPTAADPRGWQFALKYAFDRIAAAGLLLVALPIFLAAAVATWLSVGRPIFFRQTRIGLDGREFVMFKFRSMRDGLAAASVALGPDTAPGGVEGDDRRTRVGTLLRRTSIDELPQLLNVLTGDMSIVGPRPERPEFVKVFDEQVYRYRERHRVKSGITGWAQVNGLRGKTSIADRTEWDNYYIENWSLWLDLKILARTFSAVVRPGTIE